MTFAFYFLETCLFCKSNLTRRCSEIFAVKIPGSSLAATRRLTGGSRGSASAALTAPAALAPRPARPCFRLSPPPLPHARHPEKCFAPGSHHTPHKRRRDAPRRRSLRTAYQAQHGRKKMETTLPSGQDKPIHRFSAQEERHCHLLDS